jgi:hypothetical protein
VEHFTKQKVEAFRLTEAAIEEVARAALEAKYGKQKFLLGVASPYVVLNRQLIEQDGKDLREVRQVVAAGVDELEGVYLAHPLDADLPEGPLGQKLAAAIFPERSGDVYVVPEKHSLFLQSEKFAATHGSPWDYDTHVPILLVFPGRTSGVVSERRVDVRSLVPTVSQWMGISPPLGATFPLLEP